MNTKIYPLLFKPIYKNYIWGGNYISKKFNRPSSDIVQAESWEISDRTDGMSIIENGFYKGKSLNYLIQLDNNAILGNKVKGGSFPLLIKLIDAKKKLSLQVHPNEESSKLFGGEAKTELWYILESNNAYIYHGFNQRINKRTFLNAIKKNILHKKIKHLPVSKHDSILVEGGCVHAIDSGCLILEIQQNSNTTYRIHDWGRDKIFHRDLHINDAINNINWDKKFECKIKPILKNKDKYFKIENIGECEFFKAEKITIKKLMNISMNEESFHTLFVIDGNIKIEWGNQDILNIPSGRSCLIPANLLDYRIIGKGTLIRTMLP